MGAHYGLRVVNPDTASRGAVESTGPPGPTGPTRPIGTFAARGPLVVRLRNWVGDVLLGLPMLQRLSDAGFGLHLVGKGWARDLLAGHGWPVHALAATFGERWRLLRQLRECTQEARAAGQHIDALCLPFSFSSALEFRLAGLHALGHAHEARRLLLARALPRAIEQHELATYWQVGDALLGASAPLPPQLGLVLAPAHRAAARALRAAHGIDAAPIVICPFAGGTYDKQPKTWPPFADFVREELLPLAAAASRRVLICPGPGEQSTARSDYPGALCLEGVGLGTYGALLAEAALMISNDTGPGHLAAAVGAPLLSVLGPTQAQRWGAWGPSVRTLGGDGHWATRSEVLAAVRAELAAPSG